MRVAIYSVREDEMPYITKYEKSFSYEITIIRENLNRKTVEKSAGCEGVIVIGDSQVDKEVINRLAELKVKYIASRSIGYNNIDLNRAKELNFLVSNATYSPYSVSEYTIFYSIMLLRNLPKIFKRMEEDNYTLKGLIGKELWAQTIGVIGTGKIGKAAIRGFLGMGCKVIAYDMYPDESLKDRVEYVEFDELLKRADIITTHLPLTNESYHIINRESIAKMKEGAILINTARGELVDTEAVLEGLESGKLGGVALDVLENEEEIFKKHNKESREYTLYKKLKELPNVILTPHISFYTEQAVHDMVYSAMYNMDCFIKGIQAPNSLIK